MTSESHPVKEPTPFEHFREFTRKLVAVPKAEIEKEARRWRKRRREQKRRA